MATRDTQDNRINVYKDALKDAQTNGRASRTWGSNYGQVLRNGGRPSDQPNDGPTIPANLQPDAWIDVYESTLGFGFKVVVEAEETGVFYLKTLISHEGGAFAESAWIESVPLTEVP